VFTTLGRLAVAAAVAGVPTLLVLIGLDALLGESWLASVVELIVGGLVLVATYVAVAFALRVREVRELGGMVRSRLGR
jgi:putative peptidoglycan lipid II flippase